MSSLTVGTLVCLGALVSSSVALSSEGRRANSVSLNGPWQVAVGSGDERAERPEGRAGLEWRRVVLPGEIVPWTEDNAANIKFVWARRQFHVSGGQAERLAVLRWNRIALGAVAFVNGTKVGENEPTGPYQVILPAGLLRPGENEIVLRITGAAGVRRSKSGYLLIPAGFSSNSGRGISEVTDDIWIDFADRAYVKWALAIPDLVGSKVAIRVTLTGTERVEDLVISAEVAPWPDGRVLGRGECRARLVPDPDPLGGAHVSLDVPMPGFRPWTHEDPNLYLARLSVTKDGEELDALSFRFGMREIDVRDGNFKLNGKNLWLRGSNLVFEWNWGDIITGKERDYLATEAREMSMNAFRTHTQPPPRRIADVCDEHGTFLLAEFPCLYNWSDYRFTPEEYEVWHKNVLTDAAGWMARLWNHPSVIIWVLSNESPVDAEWEMGPYYDLVRRLDPTRPTMRSGSLMPTGTRENLDIHQCHNIERTDEGHLLQGIPSWFDAAEGRALTNSEYMNYFRRPVTQWTGTEDKAADAIAVGQIGMEHTEAMRRARLDGILPYMYAGWTRTRRDGYVWKAGYADPLSAVWHSALSPVLASLDLFDANYLVGQDVTTDLYLINDSWHDATIHVDLLLTREDPQFIPEADCFDSPVARWSYDYEVKADSITKTSVAWRLPDEEGQYWLTARTTGASERPVLSQRFVRAIAPALLPEAARERTFVVLGGDSMASDHFDELGLTTSGYRRELEPGEDVVIVWKAGELTDEEKAIAPALCRFAAAGGRVVVLSTTTWDWPELCEVEIPESTEWWGERLLPYSRAFAYEGVQHPVLSSLPGEWLMRWNGLPGTVAIAELRGAALDRADKILWAREPGITVAAALPTVTRDGKILFCQLDLQNHVHRGRATYDPAAERIWFSLLAM